MRTTLVVLSSAACGTILTACALLTNLQGPEPVSRAEAVRVACAAFRPVTWSLGDETRAVAMLRDVQTGSRPATKETLDVLRDIAGDTNGTVAEVKAHNAAYVAICPRVTRDPRSVAKGQPAAATLLR